MLGTLEKSDIVELANYTDDEIGKAIRVSMEGIKSQLDSGAYSKKTNEVLKLAITVINMAILDGRGEL